MYRCTKAKADAAARKDEAAKQVPKTAVPAKSKAIPAGRYCAKLNAMGMFEVEVNLDVQTNHAFTFEVGLCTSSIHWTHSA